jgi:hypothetical protein
VFDDADEEKVMERVGGAVQRERVETRLELKLNDAAFRNVLARVTTASARSLMGRALARALPWYRWKARQLVEVRESAYAPIWEALLADKSWSPTTAASAAARALRHHPIAKEIYDVEGVWPSTGLITFASVLHAHPGTAAAAEQFWLGLDALAKAVQGARPAAVIEETFRSIQGMWGQSFHLKAAGVFLLALAAQTPEGVGAVERTFTVAFPESNAQVVFGTPRKPNGA